jgi:hypothetical protein
MFPNLVVSRPVIRSRASDLPPRFAAIMQLLLCYRLHRQKIEASKHLRIVVYRILNL